MHFSGGINRPPYETADGYLQTTEGCSHNTCLFCTYFKDQKFRKEQKLFRMILRKQIQVLRQAWKMKPGNHLIRQMIDPLPGKSSFS